MGARPVVAQRDGRAAADRSDGEADRQLECNEDQCRAAAQRTEMKALNFKQQAPEKFQAPHYKPSVAVAMGVFRFGASMLGAFLEPRGWSLELFRSFKPTPNSPNSCRNWKRPIA